MAYADKDVQEAIDFMINRLPNLIAVDKAKALDEFDKYSDALNRMDENDVLFMVGHLYAVSDQAKEAIKKFMLLVDDPRLGEDSRRMLNLLLYYRAVYYLQNEDKELTQSFLQDILEEFPVGKYYPIYLYLWADLVSESDNPGQVTQFIASYNQNRMWLDDNFKPAKQRIIERISNLDLYGYFQNPTEMNYLVLDKEIGSIQTDLQTLYNELQSRQGLMAEESIARISDEETGLLDDLKTSLKSYYNPPPLNLETLARVDSLDAGAVAYRDYQEGALILEQLKGTAKYYGDVLDIMDRFFDSKYDLVISGDKPISGESYSDLELKRLFDIEKNIYTYTDLISAIDAVMADPNYLTLNTDLRPQRQEYVEKLADLQQRKQRYLAVRVHPDDSEEALFTEFLEEYYALNREKRMFDEVLPEAESAMYDLIRTNYPKRLQKTMQQQQTLASTTASGNMSVGEDMSSFITNLDFIYLQMDYRQLRYEEQQAKSREATLSEAELQTQYSQIQERKRQLLREHQDFVARNAQVDQLEQPSGGYLLNNSIVYYNMAELQYAVDMEHPELALNYYRKVLEIDPEFFLKDYALYNIGYTSSELKINNLDTAIADYRARNPKGDRPADFKYKESDLREALDAYTQLGFDEQYKDSPLRDEALYRLGVLYFILGSDADVPRQYFAEASKCFNLLADKPDSKFKWDALYQRAWVNMNQGDDQSLQLALNDFITLIKAADERQISDPYVAADYRNNAIDNIAYTLVAADGADFDQPSRGVDEIKVALADYQDRQLVNQVLDKAAEHKIGMQATLQAIDFMEMRLQNTPLDLNNPAIVDSILALYRTPNLRLREGSELASIKSEKDDFIKASYNNNSAWYRQNIRNANLNSPLIQKQLAVIKNAYESIRIQKYNTLVTTVSDAAYADYYKHLGEFESYRELFGDQYTQWQAENDRTNTLIQTVLAEKRNTDVDFYNAYLSLCKYNDKYLPQENSDYLSNEGLAYKYAKYLYQDLNPRFETPGFQPAAKLPSDSNRLYEFFRDASLRFNNVLNMSAFASAINRQNSAQVMMYLADIELDRDLPEIAKSRYNEVLAYKDVLDNPTLRTIYLNLAQIEEQGKRYSSAEQMYRESLQYASGKTDAETINQLIKLQIQNSYQQAEQQGNFDLAGDRYLIMSQEYKADPEKYFGYRYQASEAFKKAGKFQQAIDLKLELAKTKTAIQDVYYLYYEAWTIADKDLRDQAQADKLKGDFVAMYPASNYAFNLRVEKIEALRASDSRKAEAAQMYLALHDEVRAGKIDSGDSTSEDIYLWAVNVYQEMNDKDKVIELLDYFTRTYPNNPKNNDFLMILADEYLARQDYDKFEYYARELYLRDKTKSDRYLYTANRKLGELAAEFDAAFAERNWTLAFKKRDDFKKLEAGYLREDLTLDTTHAYAAFAYAEEQYRDMQARQQYLADFDKQIAAVEKGKFLGTTANALVPVSKTTTWNNHLYGGKYEYVPNLRDYVDSEYKKVMKVLDSEGADVLDNPRRLRALMTIGRVNDYAAEIIDGQTLKYFNVANEMASHRSTATDGGIVYDNTINNQLWPYAQQFSDQYRTTANEIYLSIYDTYIAAGYNDQYTANASKILSDRNLLPEYTQTAYPLDTTWNPTLKLPEGGTTKVKSGITTSTSPKGAALGHLTIPAGHTLILDKEFSFAQTPQYAFLNMAYPYDPVITVNSQPVELVFIPVDTLGTQQNIRYAIRVDGSYWQQGQNTIHGEFTNTDTVPAALYFGASFVYPIQQSISETSGATIKYSTDDSWTVIKTNAETGSEQRSYAIVAQNFPLDIVDNSEYLSSPEIKPVWAAETPSSPANSIAFEYQFSVDQYPSVIYLDFVAPDVSTVKLNSKVVLENYPVDYDVDPFVLYPRRLALPRDLLVSGENTLRFEINNMSPNRGFLAEISLIPPDKE